MLATSFLLLAAPVASAETRTLKLYYTHTRERAEITFKKNGRYIQSGLDQLNKFLRDWRRNEPTKMDPRLFDVVWEAYQAVGARDYIHIVSAYRSPATNSMLRKRSRGVAEKSQHMLGKAMDFYIPGVKLSKLRAAALRIQGGGVGYYPASGSPFVHLDVGNVRHWPRMNRNELMALFPDGKTIHVPTDGKPLPGYQQALAAYKSGKRSSATVQLASAQRSGGFLSRLFGGGADDEEDTSEIAMAGWNERGVPPAGRARKADPAPRPPAATAATATAAGDPTPAAADSAPLPGVADPAPAAAPVPVEEVGPEPQKPETIIAALPVRSIPKPLFAPRPPAEVGPAVAAADSLAEASPPIVEVALNIPLPTRRPDYKALVQQVASAEVQEKGAQVVAATARSRVDSGAMAIADILSQGKQPIETTKVAALAPVPVSRPDWQQQAAAFAPLSDTEPEAPRTAPLVVPETGGSTKASRVAASQRLALLTRDSATDAATALGTGVRTTAKAAKPSMRDAKPDPKPVVMPVQQDVARWALQAGNVTRLRSATTPERAHDTIRTAPSTVYTVGFEQGEAADPHRFTGKAITFLSVAKFAAN